MLYLLLLLTLPLQAITMSTKISMHWFRKGLRLHDNPALMACLQGNPSQVYPVYVLDGDCYQLLRCTALRANFLVESLQDLDTSLRKLGSRLYVASGDPVSVLPELWTKFGITHLTFEEDETGEPYALKRDKAILTAAEKAGIEVTSVASETLFPLASYMSKSSVPTSMGAFQKIFSSKGAVPKPLSPPTSSDFPTQPAVEGYSCPTKPTDLPWPRSVPKDQVTPIWGPNDCRNLTPVVRGGETNALSQLKRKMANASWVATFEKPKTSCVSTEPSTTSLSPYMSLGCLSPRQFWYAIQESIERSKSKPSQPPVSLHGQLLWRDFNYLMAASANRNEPGSWGRMEGNMHCRQIPWSEDSTMLQAWQNGQTGYPWIDACMVQLKQEGWMHHLGRHAVACFLTRGDLWQGWEKGAEHFESHLLDADYALNGFNWLWLSCSGFFYQYFRCYSPIAFQKKNDPRGTYIRKYLPVLAKLPDKYIYEPWTAPAAVQKTAGIVIGKDYPKPIVDHAKVSKENMSKMSYAYDQHKEMEGKKKDNKANNTKNGADGKLATPPNKKSKVK